MSPADRVDIELHDRIESETTILRQSGDLPESNPLLTARGAVDRATEHLRKLERRASDIDRRLECLPTPTIWNRLMRSSLEAENDRLQEQSAAIFAKARKARSELASLKHALSIEQMKFTQERSQHSAARAVRQQQAMKFIKVGEIARTRLLQNPELGFAGLAHLLRLAALPRARHASLAGDEHGEFGGSDDVVLHDQWGKPYKANPLASW